MKVGSTVVATYKYNGAGQLVGTTLNEPAYFSQAYAAGASTGVFANWDRFNRVVTSAWTKDLGTDRDLYHVDLSYDRNSNITDATDTVNKNGSGTRVFDVKYTMDNLSRLTQAEEGTYSGGSISNRSRQQLWTLDQVGNQSRDKVDLNGDNDFVDSGEIDDTRTYNDPNELLTRDTDSNSSVNYTLVYNKRGDLTDDGQRYTYVPDAFGRLKTVKTRGGSPVTVAEYTYDGLGHRIGWHYDTDTDADVDASDRWYWFAHDDRWRIVATFRGTGASSTDSSPKEQFVFHAGGLNGTGGSSYIDSVILREKDDNSGWTSAADGTLELRRYYLQNWRADVSAMVEADGTQVERVKFSAYGVPIDLTPGDFNASASITSQDDTDFQAAQGGAYDVRTDLNMDGTSDFSDYLAFLNEYGSGEAGGRGILSRPSNANRIGYAGYQHAAELLGTKWHVRHRVLESELGRWTRRDPLGYIDGYAMSVYAGSSPVKNSDASGLSYLCDCYQCTSITTTPVIFADGPTLQGTCAGLEGDETWKNGIQKLFDEIAAGEALWKCQVAYSYYCTFCLGKPACKWYSFPPVMRRKTVAKTITFDLTPSCSVTGTATWTEIYFERFGYCDTTYRLAGQFD